MYTHEEMENTVKYNYWIVLLFTSSICLSSFAQIPSFATSFEENEFTYNGNRIHETYTVQIPGADGAFTFTLQQIGVKDEQINIMFFSEVNDVFNFYVDGRFQFSSKINTKLNQEGGLSKLIFYPIQFPEGSATASLLVTSSKTGEFQTEIRRENPMLYLKRYRDKWYLDHTTVVQMPQQFFLSDEN